MKQKLHLYGSLLLFSFLYYPTNLLGLTIDGELTRYRFSGKTETIPFKVALNTNLQLWHITIHCSDQQHACGSDGQKTCFIRKWSRETLKAAGVPQGIPQAKIVNGVFPGVSAIEDRIVWLAFASSSFFAIQTNPLPCLWRGGGGDDIPADYGVKIRRIDFLDSVERLPAIIEFTFSTNQLLTLTNFSFLSFKNQERSKIERSVRENQQFEGALLAKYKIKATTNYNGALLPLEFDFNFNGTLLFQGKAINITDDTPDTFLPAVNERLFTTDYRFVDRKSATDNIQYKTVNQAWLATNDPMLQTLFERMKQQLPPIVSADDQPINNTKQLFWARFILLIAILALPLFIFFRRKQTTNTKKES